MNSINSNKFREMISGGAKALEINREAIDELNVFPVPDGDTGTNMSLTIASALRETMALSSDKLDDVALAFSKGALKGARGNSGVILSQIFKGFAVVLATEAKITPKNFALCLKRGTEIAYSAVTKAKEGTILTVVRVMAENAMVICKTKNISFEDFLKNVLDAGEQILQKTPEMLPVLAKAGVVDAGGRGLITIFDGFLKVLTGGEIVQIDGSKSLVAIDTTQIDDSSKFKSLDNDYVNITFKYCTEFFIVQLKKQTTTADIDKFRDYLLTLGDCVLVIGDVDLVKVHIHTNTPEKALIHALNLGELDDVKIENMVEQNKKIQKEKENNEPEELKEYAMVSICAGEGIANIFKDLLVDVVVEGGQTMNPSVYDILNAIRSTKAKTVFVLPNNTNIILAANQAKELTESNVFVLPTTCVPEGISAALVFSHDVSPEKNLNEMQLSYASLTTCEITHAVRSTRMNGFVVKEGDIIGLHNKKIISRSTSITEATLTAAKKISAEAYMLTLYYGEGVTESDAANMVELIKNEQPDLEVTAYYGGQPHYYYLMSAE